MNWWVIAIVILIVLVVALLVYLGSDIYKRKVARAAREASNGTFDGAAQKALEAAQEVKEPTAEDRFIAADILERNVLEGDIRRARANIEVVGTIIDLYRGVVREIPGGGQGGAIFEVGEVGIGAPFMLDRVDTFIFQQGPIIANDEAFMGLFGEFLGLTNEAEEAADVARMRRAKEAQEKATNKEEAAHIFFEGLKTHENDPQNVHDPTVTDDLRETLTKIKATYGGQDVAQCLREIDSFISEVKDIDIDYGKKEAASRVLRRVMRDYDANESVFIVSFGAHEADILAFVWDRSRLEENRPNRHKMQVAVVQALADCIEDGSEVCPQGRTSRMMAALALLDKRDDGVGATVLYEEYKNEIYSRATKLIEDETKAALDGDHEGLRRVAMSYSNPKIETEAADEEAFRAIVGRKLEAMVDEYGANLRDYQIEKLKRDVLAGIP